MAYFGEITGQQDYLLCGQIAFFKSRPPVLYKNYGGLVKLRENALKTIATFYGSQRGRGEGETDETQA